MNNKILLGISIFIAITLWLYVFSGENRESFLQIPVNIIETKDGTMASITPQEVSVRVKGPQSFIFAAGNSYISIDLNVSDYPIERTVVRLSPNDIRIPGVEVLEVTPARLELNVESTVKQSIKVQPLLLGQPKKGYRVDSIEIIPETVEVEGIIEYLESIFSIQTKNINIDGIDKDIHFMTEFMEYNGVKSIEPDVVTISVTVTENILTHSFYNSRVTCINGTGNRNIEALLPGITVTVRGRSDIIDTLSGDASFAETDCSDLDTQGIHEITILPKAFDKYAVVSIYPDSTTVTIGQAE